MAKNQIKQRKPAAKKDVPIKKSIHKKRVKGTSEVDNPKFANMDFMLKMVEEAAQKEDAKINKKLAKKAEIAKIIEEKDAKKAERVEKKKEKLEKLKQSYLEAQKKKKAEARKLKIKARAEAARQAAASTADKKKKKTVRFA